MTEWERGMREAIRVIQDQIETFKSPEYATGQPASSLRERFACRQCVMAIAQKIAAKTRKPIDGKMAYICTVNSPEELRQEFVNNCQHRLRALRATLGVAARKRDQTAIVAKIELLEELERFWTNMRLEPTVQQENSPT